MDKIKKEIKKSEVFTSNQKNNESLSIIEAISSSEYLPIDKKKEIMRKAFRSIDQTTPALSSMILKKLIEEGFKLEKETTSLQEIEEEAYRSELQRGFEEGLTEKIEKCIKSTYETGVKAGVREGLRKELRKGLEKGYTKTLEKILENLKENTKNIKPVVEKTGISEEKILSIFKIISENSNFYEDNP